MPSQGKHAVFTGQHKTSDCAACHREGGFPGLKTGSRKNPVIVLYNRLYKPSPPLVKTDKCLYYAYLTSQLLMERTPY